MRPNAQASQSVPKCDQLEALVQRVLDVTKKARKHGKCLLGDNHYANKLVELRADAVNTFRDLTAYTPGDISAMAEMIEEVFAAKTNPKRRTESAKELIFNLRTTWRDKVPSTEVDDIASIFPLSILSEANRGYLITIGRQMNGCYSSGWCDACAVMMRRLLEAVIIEAFENKHVAHKVKDAQGNYQHLSDLIQSALGETAWTLSRNTRKVLPQMRDIGHQSAHGRYFCARKEDIDKLRPGCRVVIEEFLHHAGLL
jgi:hypothetical protein